MPAVNGRFCKMAAVAPQKRQCELAREYPAASAVEAATSQSRWDDVPQSASLLAARCRQPSERACRH